MNFRFPQCVQVPFRQVIPNASNEGLQVLKDMLLWNPQKRPSAPQTLRYSFFQVGADLVRPPPPVSKTPVNLPSQPSPSQKPSGKPPSTFPKAYPEATPLDFGASEKKDKVGTLPAVPAMSGAGKQNDNVRR